MLLAHQGERTVTDRARRVTNHYQRLPACELSPAGAKGREAPTMTGRENLKIKGGP